MKRNSRNWNKNRNITVVPDFCPAAAGSALITMGNTRVICAASVEKKVPSHAEARGTGWLTADYTLLPYSTSPRTEKEFLKRDSRSIEIKRLIARSLRGAVDLSLMQGLTIHVDCDVLQADGGTRTSAITGAYIALQRAIMGCITGGVLDTSPLITQVAAVSVGIVEGSVLLDLDFLEDSQASVDMNVVMNSEGEFIEVQGTGEKRSFTKDEFQALLDAAEQGVRDLLEIQRKYFLPHP